MINLFKTKEIINIGDKLYIQIKSIEKINDEIYKIIFVNGQTYLMKGGSNG